MRKGCQLRLTTEIQHFLLGIFISAFLLPHIVFSQTPEPTVPTVVNPTSPPLSQLYGRVDSLYLAVDRLTILVHSQLEANNTRIEGMKEATDRSFWVLVVLGAIGSIIGGAFVLGERARQKQHHQDYSEERTFYEQRAKKYERRQQAIHDQMLNIAATAELRNSEIHRETLQFHQNQVTAGQDAIAHTQKLFELLETNFEKINAITAAVASGAGKNVGTLNEVLLAFQRIMEFKVVEAKEAAELVESMKKELSELESGRQQQVEELRDEALRLIRKRFVYANPDADLQRLLVEYRTKMDSIPNTILTKYSNADSPESRDWRYGEIFLRRGVIAYYENDPAKARQMLKTAERFYPFSGKPESLPNDQRFGTAFTQYYLALIEKNYGDPLRARDHIEVSYRVWGHDIDYELITPTTRAEILSYLPAGITKAREAIAEIIQRVAALRSGGRTLAKHDAMCALRTHLLMGNTYYLEGEWSEALRHYQNALQEDQDRYYSYYAFHSIAQAMRKLDREAEAEEQIKQAYEHLLESRHLETKVALDTQILLNALAYLCIRKANPIEAAKYRHTMLQHWIKIQEVDGLQLRLFSLEQKRQVSKDEFWKEIFDE